MAENSRRFKLILHYDGSAFHGWQLQPEERTVQGELERVLQRLTGAPRRVMGAGRTDRGVHATGQVASVVLPARWNAEELQRALNALLPRDVWVKEASVVPHDFHPRYHARVRSYTYRIGTVRQSASPFHRRWCWPLGEDLPLDGLNSAAAPVEGIHRFGAFAKSGQPERGEICHVHAARWSPWRDIGVQLEIDANRYLHRMVRYLVGTMVDCARGRRPMHTIAGLLDDPDSGETSPPAPPQGLFLTAVAYE